MKFYLDKPEKMTSFVFKDTIFLKAILQIKKIIHSQGLLLYFSWKNVQ